MTLDELQAKLNLEVLNFGRFQICLEHNGNFFFLSSDRYGFAAFKEWWDENEEAYLIANVSVGKFDAHVLLKAVTE